MHDIYYDMLRLFLLYFPLIITSKYVDSLTNPPIQIFLPMNFHIYLTLFFMRLIFFPKILHVSLNICFVTYLPQKSFSVAHALCFVTCYAHLVHVHHALGVRVTWVKFIIYITPYPFYTNP